MISRKVLLVFSLFSSLLSAQPPAGKQQERKAPAFLGPCSNLVCEIENDWSRNNALVYGLADAMPEDKYTFKPTPAQQSFGERVLHVAQVNMMLLQALGAKTSAPAIDMNATSKAASMAAVQRVGEYGVAIIREFGEQGLLVRIDSPGPMGFFMGPKMSRLRVLYFLMSHSQDTYGQLVVYARLKGVTPPASRQP
ncbi:MAG: DinB family protein [Acidobacteriia bacterium]|nr:DinB family protein [Terriglobia bacterium]MBV8905463.1 DinB family protein [Terriglobia bacterium]